MKLHRQWIIAAAVTAVTAPASSQNVGSIEQMAQTPVVTVRIAESLRSPPDEASLTLSSESKAATAAAALEANKLKIARLIAAVRRAGIVDKDMQTEGVNINPDYTYDTVEGRSVQRLVGYAASNSVRIKTRRIDSLSALLDSLTAAGADRIYGPSFEIADPLPLRREARRRAMARGQSEALEYATNAGFTRVGLLSVEEGISSLATDIVVTGARIGPPRAAPAPPAPPAPPGSSIQPGQIETGVAVTLRYRMER